MLPRRAALALALTASATFACSAVAQELALTGEGPIEILADGAIEWRRNEQVVIASGNARAIRGATTVYADRLLARYRSRGGSARPAAPSPDASAQAAFGGGGGEIFRLEADGSVRIITGQDRAEADRAVYDLDRRVLVMTGRALKLTNGTDTVTARDALEYWVDRRMAVARGGATVTSPGRALDADTLVAYFREAPAEGAAPRPAPATQAASSAPPALAPGSGRLDRVEAFGDVRIRTATEFVRGDRGIYTPDTGIARIAGNVGITRGQNQLVGEVAEVNLQTGVSRLLPGQGGRVAGLLVPEERARPDQPGITPAPVPGPSLLPPRRTAP
ncbi:LptA/OstA family protein [Elioraea rosea]|uniref:LptA/OstA family protein n=1 Tax=Elioraea rosea TaxID=2492390 RepID=UPI0011830F40|nr:LptA/OstA family protein [Elioraea rosea]